MSAEPGGVDTRPLERWPSRGESHVYSYTQHENAARSQNCSCRDVEPFGESRGSADSDSDPRSDSDPLAFARRFSIPHLETRSLGVRPGRPYGVHSVTRPQW